MRQQFRHQVWIVLAAAVVFFTNLGAVALWDKDESLYASCAREMFQRGDWVVPTFNGEVFPDKPPLMFWLMMSGFQLFGVTEFAARFWSAVLGVGTALVTYHLGRLLFRAEVGLWAGLIVASTIIFTVSARAATVDSALVFLTTLAALLFVSGWVKKSEKTDGGGHDTQTNQSTGVWFLPDSWILFALMYACLGVAVLAKGPVGVLLPVAMIGLFLLIINQSARDRRRPAVGWATVLMKLLRPFAPRNLLRATWQMRPLTAVGLLAAVALPWYIMVGLQTDGEWLVKFFGVHNLHRALKPMQGHGGPVFYYIPAILIGFFPWSVFLGPSLIELVRRVRQNHAWKTGYIFVACWTGVFVGFWSIAGTKLPHYVLPAYPALALLTAAFVDAWITDPVCVNRWWLRNANATLVVVGIGMIVALPIIASIFLPGEWMLGLVGLVLVVGGALSFFFAERDQPSRAMVAFAVMSVVFLTGIFGFAALRVDRYQNAPVLVAEIRKASPGQPQLAGYRFFRESLVFYAGEPVPHYGTADQLQEFLDTAKHPYVFTTDKHEEELQRRFPGAFSVLIRRPRFLRSGEVVVLGRRLGHDALQTVTNPAARTIR